ncbi:MAG: hypothetical protein HY074_07565 [Deltaproteobacteria bacterium]|nr:hypothetical protein [Deltaproteobacteria bacterium]
MTIKPQYWRLIMSLLVSKVPRALETKARLFGFELGDLLLIFLYLALSNLIFGQTRLKFPLVWLGTAALAAALYFLKRGKPDNYLQHAGEHFWSAGVLSAGATDVEYRPYQPFQPMNDEVKL